MGLKATTQHLETLSLNLETPKQYNRAPSSVPDHKLPFIAADEVSRRTSAISGGLCEWYLLQKGFWG